MPGFWKPFSGVQPSQRSQTVVAPCFTEKSHEGNESCSSSPYAALILFSIVSAGSKWLTPTKPVVR